MIANCLILLEAAGSGGRAGRVRARSGDGEGWGRDRAREAPKNDVINGT